MEILNRLRELRLPLSSLACLIAFWICLEERHIHVVLSDPGTYTSPLHHRCGLLLTGCLLWALTELSLRFVSTP